MRKFVRFDEPEILKNNWENWGLEYERKRNIGTSNSFVWLGNSYEQVRLQLIKQTDEHCSYCDNAHLKRGDFTIDHFKPKSHPSFYRIAYKWDNLFFSCGHCQTAKGRQFSENILRPDAPDYEFSRYFSYDYTEHEILTNTSAPEEDQQKAVETIKVFELNHLGQKKARRSSFREYNAEQPDSRNFIQDYSYRFILE